MEKDPAWLGHVLNWLGLAMTNHRLGNADEARRWLDKATDWIDKSDDLPSTWYDIFPIHPHDWLACLLLRREAAALIH